MTWSFLAPAYSPRLELVVLRVPGGDYHPQHDVLLRTQSTRCRRRCDPVDCASATFVDAAQYSNGTCFVAVTTRIGALHHATSVATPTAETAELAIALATLDPTCHTIVCDSRSAIANFSKGRISPQELRILRQAPHSKDSMIILTWICAHAGPVHPHLPNLNEVTYSIARGLVNHAGATGDEWDTRDNLTSYNDLVKAFYLSRRVFPPPHPS
ncbi:hypothetical protein HPB50_028962 [Hyalomma asiaticum]|nr:hypothetical protein HPB50_028962 [Hyalomma asiaticum]